MSTSNTRTVVRTRPPRAPWLARHRANMVATNIAKGPFLVARIQDILRQALVWKSQHGPIGAGHDEEALRPRLDALQSAVEHKPGVCGARFAN